MSPSDHAAKSLQYNECERGDSNPYTLRCQILSVAPPTGSPSDTQQEPASDHCTTLHRNGPFGTGHVTPDVTRHRPPAGMGSHYSWLARSSFVLAAILIVGCVQPDSRLVSGGYQTTKEGAARVTQAGPAHLVTVPAFYLVADDNAVCEVDSTRYVSAKIGSRVVCEWSQR